MKNCSMSLTIAWMLCLVLMGPQVSHADFEEDLGQLLEENGTLYMQPLVNSVSIDLNTGLFHTAEVHGLFGFDIGLKMVSVLVPDEAKTFEFVMPDPVTIDIDGNSITIDFNDCAADEDIPTVLGSDEAVSPLSKDNTIETIETALAEEAGLSSVEIAALQTQIETAANDLAGMAPALAGINLGFIPLVFPQASIGVGFGTDLMLRFFPTVDLGGGIEIGFIGFGARHSISQYIPLCPVDIAVMAAYQSLKVGTILESNHINFSATVSKDLPFLTLFGGLGYDISNLEMTYIYEEDTPDEQEISYSIDGENGVRANAGLSLNLIPFTRIVADYTISKYPVASLSLVVNFR